MKNTMWLMRSVAVAVCALALPLASVAASVTKTPFTQTEVSTFNNFGTVITDGQNLLVLGASGMGVITTGSDPRVLGTSATALSAVWDIHQLEPLWGSYHKVGPGGTWDGYVALDFSPAR